MLYLDVVHVLLRYGNRNRNRRYIQRTRAAVLAGAKEEKHGANNTHKKKGESRKEKTKGREQTRAPVQKTGQLRNEIRTHYYLRGKGDQVASPGGKGQGTGRSRKHKRIQKKGAKKRQTRHKKKETNTTQRREGGELI
jgi:hypothetical protein